MQWQIIVQGREVDEEKARWLPSWIAEHGHWSRRRLAGELCVLWDWRDGSGRAKDFAARSFLLKMEERGWVVLPPLREAYRKPRAGIRLCASIPQEESLEAGFAEVGPASLEVVRAGTQAHRRWAYYLTHHHYLGLRVVGQNLGYLARERTGREVGALLFGAPACRCAGRVRCLKDRGFCPQKGLARIANNTRFLIFPWVKVPH